MQYENEEEWRQNKMEFNEKHPHHPSIQVEFVCRDCKERIHGCAGTWKGLGLEICCSCNCTKAISSTMNVINAYKKEEADEH
jgi:hypothetical protein